MYYYFKKVILISVFFTISNLAIASPFSYYTVDDKTIDNFEIPNFTNESIAICFWDQRIQVTDKSRPFSWLGYMRGGYGNVFGIVLESGSSFYSLLNNRAQLAFEKKNIKVKIADVSPFDDEQKAKQALLNTKCNKLLLIKLRDFKIDGYDTRYDFYVDVEITVMNPKGETLTTSIHKEKYQLVRLSTFHVGRPKYKELLPDAIRKGFYSSLSKSEIIDVVNSESKAIESPKLQEEPSQKQENNSVENTIKSDIIVTKKGDEIEAIVEEISEKTIKYKNKNQPTGPVRIINAAEVFMIKYKDGTKEIIK